MPDAARVREIFAAARAADQNHAAEAGTCQVLVCPLVARAAVVHGRRRASEDFVVPLYVPAVLSADGTLSPPGEGAPWIPRGRLEPGRDTLPVLIGRVSAVDQYLSTNDPPDAAAGWRAYWDHAWRMLDAVAEDSGWRLSEHGFDPGELGLAARGSYVPAAHGFVVPHVPSQAMVAPLLATYEHVLGERQPPALLARFAALEPREQKPPMEEMERLDAHLLHLGQMGDRHPLAPSQREALHHALTLSEGDVLAINGPPGTGKTTLLQSVVASLWVQAALEEAEPPVIVAVSTNNQAVTNVIESLGKAQQEPSTLSGRWLPGVTSYGLFCAAQSRREGHGAERFQVASERGEGFPAEVENEAFVASATTAFLAKAAEAFGRTFRTVREAVTHLHAELAASRETLREGVAAMRALSLARARAELLFGTVELAPLAAAARAESNELAEELRARRVQSDARVAALRRERNRQADDVRSERDAKAEKWKGVRTRWEEFERRTPAWIVLLSWIPLVRDHRRRLIRRFLDSVGVVAPPGVRDPVEVDTWIGKQLEDVAAAAQPILEQIDLAMHSAVSSERFELDRYVEPRETRLHQVQARLQLLDDAIARLRTAGAAWGRWVAARGKDAAAFPEALRPQPTPADALEVADRLVRVRAFQLATHYWEGRWLEEMREQLESGYRQGQSRPKQEKRWRRYAKLTPCMVSTLFKAPSFFTCWGGEQMGAQPLLSFIDLLIVDEAGQVSPELAGAAFALARRALVVGDTEQLQPVPRVTAWGDVGNLRRAGLARTDSDADRVANSGIDAAGGSAMRLAQRRSPRRIPGLPYGGMLLTEHYRCAPPIIAYCNELCYGGRLVPVRPADERPPELPRMGYAHVPGASRKSGTSRVNDVEAWTVAHWIASHAEALRGLRARSRGFDEGAPLPPPEQVVAVVTPFKAQARMIRKALEARQVRGLTVDTVHSLQGDERDVVVFSPVYAYADGGSRYMLENRSLLNVAVSRARESFLVFGDMAVFDPRRNSPAGLLARHLFRARENELTDVEVRPAGDAGPVRKLAGQQEHREALRDFLGGARETVRITSPWVSEQAIRDDGLDALIAATVSAGVRVTCYVDEELNQDGGRDRRSAAEGKRLLVASGAVVKIARRIHNKTVTVDDRLICEGSFNWLSSARRAESPFHRYERSLVYEQGAATMIQRFIAEIESRVVGALQRGE
ncbi:MAG TPA: AAA domain-containing protein [Longimicrobium sp.]